MDATARHSRRRRWYRRPVFIVPVVLAVLVGLGTLLVANNAFGRNVSGKVTCASGAGIAGVFIEAERLPRVWSNGPEIQSGFATSWWNTAPNVAEFTYWLPFGGRMSVHVGCGGTPDVWASDNHSPYLAGNRLEIICNDPSTATSQPTITTRDACRRT